MTIAEQLHNSSTHAKGSDQNCPVCKADAQIRLALNLIKDGVDPNAK